jgi:hypothetical protein
LTAAGVIQGANASAEFSLGAFSATLGYPYAAGLWQERLTFEGNNSQPNAVWGSATGAFTTFGTTNPDGTVAASNGFAFVIADDQVNPIRAVSAAGSAQAMQLGIFTGGGEYILQAATTAQALSSTNVQVYRETAYGSAPNVQPLRIGKSVIFADRPGRKLREWSFYWQVNGYLGPDKTQESEHITRGPNGSPPPSWGVRWLAYQQSPYQVIWAGRNDGGLISFTYDRDQQIWAPARHQLGGQYYGGAPIVESGCVIPSPDNSYDELWLVVLRTINGVPTRFVEVMKSYFDGLPLYQACFLDCALDSPRTQPSATLTPSGLTAQPTLQLTSSKPHL